MRPEYPEPETYLNKLEHLKTVFPVPVSNPIMDGYFVHTVSRFLDLVDDLKSSAPLLGKIRIEHYESGPAAGFPEEMGSVAEVTRTLADYCHGMTVWAHPQAQVNVIPPTSIPSILAFIVAAMYNPNIIWDEYSARFAEAEIQSVAMLADLVGYDSRRAGRGLVKGRAVAPSGRKRPEIIPVVT